MGNTRWARQGGRRRGERRQVHTLPAAAPPGRDRDGARGRCAARRRAGLGPLARARRRAGRGGHARTIATAAFVLVLVARAHRVDPPASPLPRTWCTGAALRPHAGRRSFTGSRAISWRAVLLAAALAGAALVIQAAAWWSPSDWWAWAAVVLAAAVAGRGGAGAGPGRLRSASGVVPLGRADLEARLTALARRAGAPRGTGVRVESGPPGLGHGAARRDGSLAPHPGGRHGARHAQRRRGGGDRGPRTGPPPPRRHVVECGGGGGRRGAGALRGSPACCPLAGGAFSLAGPADTAALPLVALVCGRRGGGCGAARQRGVARAGAPRRPRRAGVDGQRARARADAQAAQRRPPGRRPPSESGPRRSSIAIRQWLNGLQRRNDGAPPMHNSQFTIHKLQAGSRKPEAGSLCLGSCGRRRPEWFACSKR